MQLRRIGTIFRKELIDTLRDRKTLFFMLALPMLLAPCLAGLMSRITQSEAKKTQERRLLVQAAAEERDRLLAFLRDRIEGQGDALGSVLGGVGPSVAAPLDAIAADLGVSRAQVVLTLEADPRVREHPRRAELLAAWRPAVEAMLDDPAMRRRLEEEGGGEELAQVAALTNPLFTLEFVTPEEAEARSATHPPTPLDELPDAIRTDPLRLAAAQSIARRQVHAAIRVPRPLDAELTLRDDQVAVEVVYDSALDLSAEAHRRLRDALLAAGALVTDTRLAREELPATFVAPIKVASRDAATPDRRVLKVIGGLLPYLLILMCFVGALYPATDLGAGEKERLTLETLLVSPAARSEIALAKFGVVFLSAIVAGIAATGSMAWTFASGLAGKELGSVFRLELSPAQVTACLLLIAPLAAVFAAVMLALSLYARTQKEAQSLMMPLQFLIVIPAMISMIPTIELDFALACVPILNAALALRAVFTAGGAALPWAEIAIIFATTALLAAAAIAWCAWWFGRERVIFRS
jgi:sodium transport system permease protein